MNDERLNLFTLKNNFIRLIIDLKDKDSRINKLVSEQNTYLVSIVLIDIMLLRILFRNRVKRARNKYKSIEIDQNKKRFNSKLNQNKKTFKCRN